MKDVKRYVSIFLLALAVMLAYKLLFDFDSLFWWMNRTVRIVSPFIFGFVIAYCLNIPVAWLEKHIVRVKRFKKIWINRRARGISIIITYIVIALLTAFGLRGFIPMIYQNAMGLVTVLPGYIEQGLIFLRKLPYADSMGFDTWVNSLMETKPWTGIEMNILGSLKLAQSVFSGLFAVVLTLISSIYFLVEYHKIKLFFHRLIGVIPSDRKRGATLKYVRLVDTSFRKFLSCQFLDSLILGSITTFQFMLMGSSYSLVLGLMLGVANIIPYFGSIFGSILAVFIMVFDTGWETAIITAIVLLITQQFDGYFINPRIMGTSFKVSPVLVIIAITVGGAIGGIPGMIFAIPVANVLKTILEEFIHTRERQMQKKINSPPSPPG